MVSCLSKQRRFLIPRSVESFAKDIAGLTAFSQLALLVASKQSSYIFKYQRRKSHCITLKSNVWDVVNKIFFQLAKTKRSSSFDSSSEV